MIDTVKIKTSRESRALLGLNPNRAALEPTLDRSSFPGTSSGLRSSTKKENSLVGARRFVMYNLPIPTTKRTFFVLVNRLIVIREAQQPKDKILQRPHSFSCRSCLD